MGFIYSALLIATVVLRGANETGGNKRRRGMSLKENFGSLSFPNGFAVNLSFSINVIVSFYFDFTEKVCLSILFK